MSKALSLFDDDYVTRHMIEEFILDEQDHYNWVRGHLCLIEQIGMENILLRRSGQLAIQRDMVDCDYYRMLDGDMRATNAYHGAYMSQYSWAEITTGRLFFRGKS